MLETIYVTRHGFRADWITPDFMSPTGLPHDPPLDENIGVRQARELAAFSEDKGIEQIYSSPFYRCLQTTNEVAEKLDLDIKVENGLSEWYGTERTFYPHPADLVSLRRFFPRIETSYVPMMALPQGGETQAQCHDRVQITIGRIISSCDGTGPQGPRTILLVGHAASAICMVRALQADPMAPVASGTCCLFEFRREEGGGWKMVAENDSSFLSSKEHVKVWKFEGDVPSYEKK